MREDPRFEALRGALRDRAAGQASDGMAAAGLADLRGPGDPGDPDPGDPSAAAAPAPPLSEAAVLLTLRPTDPLELLVIQRAEKEGDPWSGHMALPGGRRQASDADLLATALRETREETGLVVATDAVLGPLGEVTPSARRRFSIVISPWVAVVAPDAPLTLEPSEVDAAIWVPLPHLASDEAVDELLIELEGESRAFPALSYQEYVIWGLTHRILEEFILVARSVGLV